MRKKLTGPASVLAATGLALSAVTAVTTSAPAAGATLTVPTATPIKHVIVIIGENHSFDNVYATYQPPAGQHIDNLLSEGIVTKSGAPAPIGKWQLSSLRRTPRSTASGRRSPVPTRPCRSRTPRT